MQEICHVYEAENAAMTGSMNTIDETTASGRKVVGNFAQDTDTLTFTVDIPADGTYDLIITSKGYGGEKTNNIIIDGNFVGTFNSTAEVYSDALMRSVLLTSGTHSITITKSWSWIAVDCLEIETTDPIPDSVFEVSDELINPNANIETKILFSYLCDTDGEQVLSG